MILDCSCFLWFDQGVCNKLHVSKQEILESGNIVWDYTVPIPKFETLDIKKNIPLMYVWYRFQP